MKKIKWGFLAVILIAGCLSIGVYIDSQFKDEVKNIHRYNSGS